MTGTPRNEAPFSKTHPLDLRRAVHRVNVEGVGGNRLDGPAVIERRAQLVRADAARAPGPWLPIAEAHEVASAGWSQHSREAGDVSGPVVVAEYVEHPAIDHGVDSEAEAAEVECVCDFEPRGQSALGRFRARPRESGRRNVDAGDIGATTGCQQRVLAGAAASVEKASGQAALASEPDKSRLRPADVPRGRRAGGGS